ncbi:AraC family transcriptional regulator [Paenibacillus sp. HWE-109]|uniref:helix-turn-helix domain-containing protein n=1 Tax=Paenibacillus sp. HWE-109 TaxID=1306526 RepID=UPI001EDFA79F|nr:helix-turn-helix domain-containing protein [Paenibacillus sp. HWE-109]UKS26875.1 AraC family transcriptional regulator [Paenibacillus sp. HWE-109]
MVYRKRSIRFTYFISYIVIFAIPLITLGMVLYSKAVVEMQKEVERYTLSKVNRMKETMDSELLETQQIAVKVASDESIKPYTIILNDYRSKVAVDQLAKYRVQSFVDNIFVQFSNDPYIYSVEGKMSMDTMLQKIVGTDDQESQAFLNSLNRVRSSARIGENCMPASPSATKGNLFCLYSLPLNGNNPYGVVGIKIDHGAVESLAEDLFGTSGGILYVLNSDMQQIYTFGDEEFLPKHLIEDIIAHQPASGISSLESGNQQLSVIDTTSDNSKFRYILVLSPKNYLNHVIEMRQQVTVIIIVVVIIGVLLALILAKTSYRPIKALFDSITAHGSQVGHTGAETNGIRVNEIDSIERMFRNIVQKNSGLTERLNSQSSYVREQILQMLLKGRLAQKEKIRELLSLYEMSFDYEHLYVAVLQKAADLDITGSELTFYLAKLQEENELPVAAFCIDTVQGDLVLIVNASHNFSTKVEIYPLMASIQVFFDDKFGLRPNIGVGRSYDDIHMTSRSFLEALSVLDVELLINSGSIVFIEDIASTDNQVYWYPRELQIRLEQSMKQGNAYVCKEIIREIVGNMKERQLSSGMSKMICFNMIHNVMEILNEFEIRAFDDDIEGLTHFASLDDLQFKLELATDKLCKHIEESKESGHEELKIVIIDYIHDHYTNSSLGLDMVADMFGISPKYLSRFFKQQIGVNFAEYIKSLRIELAKKLLSETDKSVKEVVTDVGYNDAASFTRTFRQMEGIPPGRFREIVHNQGS